MLLELELAERELAEMAGGTGGQVRVGAVTGPAMDRVLPALVAAREALPQIQIEVVVATSDVLCAQLLAGRLDFALARLPETGEAARLRFDYIAPEPLCLMARRGHPLAGAGPIEPAALLSYDWVMPGPEAILTRTVQARLRALRLPDPPRRVATSSFLFTLAMLRQSDAIAPLARAVAALFAGAPGEAFAVLPVDLEIEVAPFGLLTREGPGLTPAAERVRELILSTAPTRP
jgi:DNA-binding transcriptional LysR family regulator